ncbi:MAG: hemerythrin domain-containing protein [Solimonas sp.]
MGSARFPFTWAPDAVELVKADHREIEGLFRLLAASDGHADQVALACMICHTLIVHAELEERVFYPQTRGQLDGDAQRRVEEAVAEHAALRGLMDSLSGLRAGDASFEARLALLKDYAQRHIQREETGYLPRVAHSRIDLRALGAQMQDLKDDILAEHPPIVIGNTVRFPSLSSARDQPLETIPSGSAAPGNQPAYTAGKRAA